MGRRASEDIVWLTSLECCFLLSSVAEILVYGSPGREEDQARTGIDPGFSMFHQAGRGVREMMFCASGYLS